MLEFIEDLKILIINLGFNVLKPLVNKKELDDGSKIYYLISRWSDAKWIYTEEWFIVFKWSIWPKELVKSEIDRKQYAFRNRPKLLKQWIIKEKWDMIIFVQNHLFSSPSGASDIVLWRSSNWWTNWKDENWHTLDENERKDLKVEY